MKFVIVLGDANKTDDPVKKEGDPRYNHHFEVLYEMKAITDIRKSIREHYKFTDIAITSLTVLTQDEAKILSPKTYQRIMNGREELGNLDGFVEIKD